MKKRTIVVGLILTCCVAGLVGCQSKKTEPENQKQILDYVDEDQVAGNNLLIEAQLKSAFEVPEDVVAEKSAELMERLFQECNVTSLSGSQPLDGNKLLLEDENGTVWQVDVEGKGKDIKFGKIRETGSEVSPDVDTAVEPDVVVEPDTDGDSVEVPEDGSSEDIGGDAVTITE